MSDHYHPPAALATYIEQFVRPTPDEYALLAGRVEERVVKKGAYFHRQGQISNVAALVESGIARHLHRAGNTERTNWFSFPGEAVTESNSFFSQQPSQFSIVAATDLRLHCFTRANLHGLYAASPIWERFGRLALEAVFLLVAQRAFTFQSMSAQARYEELLQRHPRIELEVPLKHVASYLGIAPATLSRLRKQ